MSKVQQYPEHEKLHVIKDQSQACGDFLDWLGSEKRIVLAREHQHDEGCYDDPTSKNRQRLCGLMKNELAFIVVDKVKLLAEYFEIDQAKLEAEKVAMLEEMRASR